LRIPQTWDERGYAYPKDTPIDELILVPQNAQYYAAFGAVIYGLCESADAGRYKGIDDLRQFITHGRKAKLGEAAGPPLVRTDDELERFREQYKIPKFEAARFERGSVIEGYIGLDGGSTSSKAVLIDREKRILKKEYQLSKGNPIQDTKEILGRLQAWAKEQGATLAIQGFGATGYAADVLEECVRSDANVVETVAHMMAATTYFGDVDVICDIGGQDIKVLFMQNGDIKNFRLSNQCSAGNGMLLQAMADQFGLKVTEYADTAFEADLSPKFSYGCAVFLDSDRVNFQKEGYSKEELLAGLAQVLPKNVWQYVVQIPRLAALGRKFVLQGGTQYNLAAVKAQVDYIKERVPDGEVLVHPHCGEAGAIGAAFEALRIVERRGYSTFIGVDAAVALKYESKNDEETVCHFCPNECKRTFIDTFRPDGTTSRYISGFSCEKGTVESKEAMLALVSDRKKIAKKFPNLVDYESKQVFRPFYDVADLPEAGTEKVDHKIERTLLGGVKRTAFTRGFERSSKEALEKRKRIRIGIPRAMNIYSTAPFWRHYFQALGFDQRNLVFSEYTTEEIWVEGGKYGSIDPCYPSKVVQAHIHNLLFHQHTEDKPLHYIFFPVLTHVPNFVSDTMDNAACPIVAGVPEVMKAAFTKETDFFATRGITYLDPAFSFQEPTLMRQQLFAAFGELFSVTQDESDFAFEEGMKALNELDRNLQEKGRAILEQVETENRIAILVIGRPYHLDPGLNHGIPEEFQVLGYPILSIRSIPKDAKWLERFYQKDLAAGVLPDPLALGSIWPENYSANSAAKVWAANFASHHPNVALLDLSSFKCGHDAPTYGLIDNIVATAGTPYSALHDIDANKPGGSIKIRVKTYAHSLKLHQERLEDVAKRKEELAYRVDQKREQLLELKRAQLAARRESLPAELDAALQQVRSRMAAYELKRSEEEKKRLERQISQEAGLVQIGIGKKKKESVPPPVRVVDMPFVESGSGIYAGVAGLAAKK
jgi:predicted nucleotide-binding protein (sugar kinase/HSP70/actin superfamily)/activator of 2-hydroxyglutaryl-CoA dehydratase